MENIYLNKVALYSFSFYVVISTIFIYDVIVRSALNMNLAVEEISTVHKPVISCELCNYPLLPW